MLFRSLTSRRSPLSKFPLPTSFPLLTSTPLLTSRLAMPMPPMKLVSHRPAWMERLVGNAGQTPPPKRSRVADQSPPPKMEHHIPDPEPNIKSPVWSLPWYIKSVESEPEPEDQMSFSVMDELMNHTWNQYHHPNPQEDSYEDCPNMAPMDTKSSGLEKEDRNNVPEVSPQGKIYPNKARLRLSTLSRPKATAPQRMR